jgi:hypothetical protein
VGPRADLNTVEKRKIPFPCRESNPGRPVRSPSPYQANCPGFNITGIPYSDCKHVTCYLKYQLAVNRMWLAILLHSRDIPGSNPDVKTRHFSCLSSAPRGTYGANILNQTTIVFFQMPLVHYFILVM